MKAYSMAIGWRYTRATRKSGLLSFLSSISMAGLVLGVSLLVLVLSVMNGFERELKDRILGLMPQASLYQAGGLRDWQGLSARISGTPGLRASAPFIQVNGLLSYRQRTVPGLVYGVEMDRELALSNLAEFVDAAALEAMRSSQSKVLIGVDLAEKLGVEAGAEIMVLAPSDSGQSTAKIAYLEVAGFVQSRSELDQSLVLANLQGLESLRPASRRGTVDGLRLQFDEVNQAPRIASEIAGKLGRLYYQTNWQRTHGNLYHAIQMSKTMVGLLMSLIVALATFNVVSTLILVVIEKQSSIAILRTLGASSRDILDIFIVQGLVIGAGDVALGLLIGIGLTQVVEPFVHALESTFHLQFLHSDVYPLTDIPAEVLWADIFQVATTAMVLVFLATLFPAWKAARLQPAEVLRYE